MFDGTTLLITDGTGSFGNAVSFPSKILTYLAYGIKVVSPHIDCVTRSEIDHLVSYYYSDSPEEIAKSIMSVNIDEDVDCAGELNRLDNEFRRKLPLFLSNCMYV